MKINFPGLEEFHSSPQAFNDRLENAYSLLTEEQKTEHFLKVQRSILKAGSLPSSTPEEKALRTEALSKANPFFDLQLAILIQRKKALLRMEPPLAKEPKEPKAKKEAKAKPATTLADLLGPLGSTF